MNTYRISYRGPFAEGHAVVPASNIHTAVTKVLYPTGFRRKPESIRRGQTMTITVTRLS